MARSLPFEYAVRNLGRSPGRFALSVTGSALVAFLVMSSAAFVTGMNSSLRIDGSDSNVIILGSGSEESVERSEISPRSATIIAASVPGIESRLNEPYVSPEIHLALSVALDSDVEGGRLAVLRGVTSRAFLVHTQVRIIEGRVPQSGNDEIMVGRLVAPKLGVDQAQLHVGAVLWIDARPWTISGIFEAPQTVMDSEIWCPLTDLQIVAQRDSLSCVVLTLDTAEVADIQVFAATRLDLELTAISEADYYSSLTDFFSPIRLMVMITAVLAAIGAVLGGLNMMYAAFTSRIRELSTLQVLGFSRFAILRSLVQESTLTAAIGAIIAISVGVLLLDRLTVRFSMGAFGLVVDHSVVLVALVVTMGLGVLGAVPPAIRCLKMPIAEALKAG